MKSVRSSGSRSPGERADGTTHSADPFTPGRLSPIILAMKASIEIGKK